jgi:hypothetical protein
VQAHGDRGARGCDHDHGLRRDHDDVSVRDYDHDHVCDHDHDHEILDPTWTALHQCLRVGSLVEEHTLSRPRTTWS